MSRPLGGVYGKRHKTKEFAFANRRSRRAWVDGRIPLYIHHEMQSLIRWAQRGNLKPVVKKLNQLLGR